MSMAVEEGANANAPNFLTSDQPVSRSQPQGSGQKKQTGGRSGGEKNDYPPDNYIVPHNLLNFFYVPYPTNPCKKLIY